MPALSETIVERIKALFPRYPSKQAVTLPALHMVQDEMRCVSVEAIREILLDEAEGADMIMVKPAGPYLDIIARVRESTTLPVAAYQVSGEYLMIESAAAAGWVDGKAIALESLMGIKRAGADMILTYYAKRAAEWLR